MLLVALGIAVCNLTALGLFLNHAHAQQQVLHQAGEEVHVVVTGTGALQLSGHCLQCAGLPQAFLSVRACRAQH